jgi:hypothetical protein
MADQSMNEKQSTDRREEVLTVRLEEALPGPALGLLQSAEARYGCGRPSYDRSHDGNDDHDDLACRPMANWKLS